MKLLLAYILKYTPAAIGCSVAVSRVYPQTWAHLVTWGFVGAAAYGDYFIRKHI